MYHTPHKYDEIVDCAVSNFDAKTKNGGRITSYVYVKR
jgi:hypothetical protein